MAEESYFKAHKCTINLSILDFKFILHGCTIGDGALIGMHATVMNGAVVGKNAVVAAGALVLENTVVPDGMVAMGVPAKVREAASPALVEANRKNAEGYVAEATAHAEANK